MTDCKDNLLGSFVNTSGQSSAPDGGNTVEVVQNRFTDAKDYGDDIIDALAIFMEELKNVAYTPQTFALKVDYPVDPEVVDMSEVPNQPEAPAFETIPDSASVINLLTDMETLKEATLQDIPEPAFDDTTFVDPEKPDPFTGTAPEEPALSEIETLDPLQLPDVEAPAVNELIIPELPALNLSTFNGTRPSDVLTEPELNFAFEEADYAGCIKDNLPAKICAILTGEDPMVLDSDITDDILTSATEQIDIEAANSYDEILNEWALKGWALPQGAMVGRLDELRSQSDRDKAMVIRDIGAKQSELAIDAIKQAMSIGAQYSGLLMEQFNQIQTRAFEVAKAGQDAALKLFDSQIVIHNQKIELYKAEADVLRTLQQGEIAVFDAYKTQMDGVKIQAEIEDSKVSLYAAKLAANDTAAKIYETRLKVISAKAEIEGLKVQVLKELTAAYQAKVNAKTAEYSGYESEVRAEQAKVQLAESKIRSYAVKIEGLTRRNEAEMQKLQATGEFNRNTAITNQGRIDVFRAEVSAISEKNSALAQKFGSEMDSHQESIKVALANYDGILKKYDANMNLWDIKAKLALEEAKETVRIAVQEYGLSLASAETGAKVYAQLAASAMNMVNASAQVSFTGHNSNSTSTDRTKAFETFSYNETLSGELAT